MTSCGGVRGRSWAQEAPGRRPPAPARLLRMVKAGWGRRAARRRPREAPAQTLRPPGLAHGASLRLVASPGRESGEPEPRWNSRGHFFAAAAEAMRRILVDNAR